MAMEREAMKDVIRDQEEKIDELERLKSSIEGLVCENNELSE